MTIVTCAFPTLGSGRTRARRRARAMRTPVS